MDGISVVLNTARFDYPMIGRPNTHLFEPTLDSLKKQTFKNFELVISDVRYDYRKDFFSNHTQPFSINHFKPDSNYWLDNKLVAIAYTRNQGIINAKYNFIVFLDDCSELKNVNYLSTIYSWLTYITQHKLKYVVSAITEYYENNQPLLHSSTYYPALDPEDNGKPMTLNEDKTMKKEGLEFYFRPGCYAGGYLGLTMDTLYQLNGYDEMYDGTKGLIDSDLALRLVNLGFNSILDSRLRVIEHHHKDFYDITERDKNVFKGVQTKCNFPLIQTRLNRKKEYTKSNIDAISLDELDFIKKWHETYEFPYTEDIKRCVSNPPIFNLQKLREAKLNGKN
jgi:hypothetical protein